MVYGDCGVIPDPNAEQLASTAVSSARTFAELTGHESKAPESTVAGAANVFIFPDLNSGNIDDIVNVAVIAALQAQLF